MTNNLPWFRVYSEILSDRKITRICARTGQPKYAVIGFWTSLLAIANEATVRGLLLIANDIPLDKEEIFLECGIDCETGATLLQEFMSLNMIELDEDGIYSIRHWENRQFASDNSTERVRKHRERKKAEPDQKELEPEPATPEPKNDTPGSKNGSNAPESNDTPENMKRFRNVIDTDTESDSETESLPIGNGDKSPPPSNSEKEPLEPDTPETRLLFAKLNQNRQAKNRSPAKRFKSLEQKEKCVKAAERLGYQAFSDGLQKAFETGITEIDRLVNWIAKWGLTPQNGTQVHYPRGQPPPASTDPLPASAAFMAKSRKNH